MTYPREWVEKIQPALPGWVLTVRKELPAHTAGGIVLIDSYTKGVKKPEAWVLASSSPDFEPGDAILLSPGVPGAATFGEGDDAVEVYACRASQVMAKFHRMVDVEFDEDVLQGMAPLPENTLALRVDRKADEGIPIRSARSG